MKIRSYFKRGVLLLALVVAVVILDVNDLKVINDTRGHRADQKIYDDKVSLKGGKL